MKTIRLLPTLLLATALATTSFLARADTVENSTIKFSDPAKPGTLKLTVSNGDIRIQGTDAAEVTVRTSLKQDKPEKRKDGMRVLSASSSYSLSEKNNVVTLNYGAGSWQNDGADFEIDVPRSSNLVVSNGLGGDIEVEQLSGDVEIKSLNSEVRLLGVSGGALVETINGEIHVEMQALAANKPVSFTSMNGEVHLRLPVDAKANIQLRSQNGTILTDFDEQQLVTTVASLTKDKHRTTGGHEQAAISHEVNAAVRDAVRVGVEAAREATRAAREAMREAQREMSDEDEPNIPLPPLPPLPPMTGGKIVTGTLNGGGSEIRVSTMNGDITLRKL